MAKYKAPDFSERAQLARQAKQRALDALKAKPSIDEAVIAERGAAQLAKAAAAAEKRQAKREAQEQARQAKDAERVAAKVAAERARPTEAELKAARDARYAARKSRKT